MLIFSEFFSCFMLTRRGFKSSAGRSGYSVIKGPTDVLLGQALPISLDQPPYAETGVVPPCFERIKPKTPDEIVSMRKICETTRKLLWTIRHRIKVRL